MDYGMFEVRYDRITAGAGVEGIGSNVLPSYFGPAVEVGREFNPYYSFLAERGRLALGFSLSDPSESPEGMAVNFKSILSFSEGHLQLLRLGGRLGYVRDLGNGEDFQGVLMGVETGPSLDFKYVTLSVAGGVGFGFIDRDDVARISTQYTFGGVLNFNIPLED